MHDVPPFEAAYCWLDVAVAWTDSGGRLLGANPAFIEATGFAAAALVGHDLATLLRLVPWATPSSPTTSQRLPPRPFAGQDAHGKPLHGLLSQQAHPTGQVITLQLSPASPASAPAADPAPPGAAPWHTLAQRLELATAATGVGIWGAVLDQPDALYWDAQMRALHGLAADQPAPGIAAYTERHVHPADRRSVAESFALLVKRREGLVDLDFRTVAADGSIRRLATRTTVTRIANPAPAGGQAGKRAPRRAGAHQIHGVMIDVTERHLTEDRLRQAYERSALATRGAGIGTWESDPDAQAGWWDEQMFKLRGRAPLPCPVQTADMMLWVHPDDRMPYTRQIEAALHNDGPSNTEFRVVWPDGQVRWLASRSVPVRDEQGRTVRRIGINWDVTDAHNAATVRQEGLLAQRESQAKSRMLARISHELRTPLNAVLGFSQLLLADGPDPATWRRRVEHVQASGEHLLALIDDVLELSSLESGELPHLLQPVAIAPLAQTSLPLVELMAQAHGVSLVLGPLAGWALADAVRLRQALLNLLSNGIKYNRRGGSVTVSAEPTADHLLLRVQDTGSGLSAEQISHLFEPFNRLGQQHQGIEGTGIGLAIVRASVQQMGGQVRVHSTPGQGTCFELHLQRADGPVAPAHAAGPAALALPGTAPAVVQQHQQAPAPPTAAPGVFVNLADGGLAPIPTIPALPGACGALPRVLYIEDNELNLLIVSELVRSRRDLQFIPAPDGRTGLALALSQQPALILLDMQLPDLDGHEVLRQLRGNPATAGIRCIALSANAMPADIHSALDAGFDAYWTKPLDIRGFRLAMDQVFGVAPA